MKRLSHLFFLLATCCLFINGFAQSGQYLASEYYSNYIPKTSSSASLGTFGNIPVNYYTGLPEISFELLRLKGREVEVPVSINYDASGVKTDEFSGDVGLKWTISAGGYVAREMNSLPDEHTVEGYWKYAKETDYFSNLDYPMWVNWCEKNERDAAPDEFTINIPGRAIKFVFNKDKKIVAIPRQNVKISHTMLGDKINGFELVTEDGTRYLFGGTPETISTRHVASLNIRFKYDYKHAAGPGITSDMYQIATETLSPEANYEEKQTDVFNARWYLTSIIATSGETTNFFYQNSSVVSYAGRPAIVRVRPNITSLDHFSFGVRRCKHQGIFGCDEYEEILVGPFYAVAAVVKYPKTNPGSFCSSQADCGGPVGFFNPKEYRATPGHLNSYHTLITESDVRLLRIESATGNKIVFKTSPRSDLPGTVKVDNVSLYDHTNALVNSITLNYDEIDVNESQDFMWPGESLILFNVGNVAQSDENFYGHHIRKYFKQNINHDKLLKYVYEGLKEYNYKRAFLSSVDQYSKKNGDETIRLYKFDYRDANLLKRRTTPLHDQFGFMRTNIDYATPWTFQSGKKAMTAYAHGSNIYTHVASLNGTLSRITYASGGYTIFNYESSGANPRLQLVQDIDENDKVASQKEIEYLLAAHNKSPVNHWIHDFNLWGTSEWMKYTVFSTSPVNEYALTHNVARGNKKVRVYYGSKTSNAGFEEFVFTSPVDAAYRDAEAPIYSHPEEQNANGENIPYVTGIYPFPRSRNRDFVRGMPLSHKIFASGKTTPLKETTYTYEVNPYGYVPETTLGLKGGSFNYASHGKVSFWYGHETEVEKRSRYSRYIYQSEWVVLKKTRSVIYDPSVADTTKNFDICTEYEYDPFHLQQIETRTYHRDNPQEKYIARTRYVTHADYNSAVPSGDPNKLQALAIQHLRNTHQINTPVEVQSLLYTGNQTKLVKAVLYKYLKQGSGKGFSKPIEIYDMNQAVDLNSYTSSRFLADGTFTSDPRLRLVHTYNTYDPLTTNLQKQTSRDGTVSTYQWGMNNSVVTGYIVNPGVSQQQQYSYEHIPLVGLKTTTDPNGRINRFEYDGFNRVRLTRDHENNILSRYRYHYRGQNESLQNDVISISCALAGTTVSLQSGENVSLGQTTYRWDFGDGTPQINTAALMVDHVWPKRGNYVVSVRKENPEYLSKEVTRVISVYNAISAVNTSINGPAAYDICSLKPPTQPTTIQASVTGDALSYVWEYKIGNGPWIQLSTGVGPVSRLSTPAPPQFGTPIVEDVFTIRLTVYDVCGNPRSTETTLTNYVSTPGCNQY